MKPTTPAKDDRGLRVLALTHVFPRFDDDPSASFLSTWCMALRAAGHDVRVLAPHDEGLKEVDLVHGTPVRRVRYADGPWERLAYRGEMHRIALRPPFGPALLGAFASEMAASLRRAVKRWQPDVVHVHWWMPGAVIARMSGIRVPTVVHLHGTDVGVVESRPWLSSLARWALTTTNRIDAVSTSLAARAERAFDVEGGHVKVGGVNPMPLDIGALLATDAQVTLDRPTVLGVGRLVPEKGFRDLVGAMSGIGGGARLRIIGEGPDADLLQDLAIAGGVELTLPGPLSPSQLPAEYARADVVVQPSHGEGFGLVAAEAVLLGRPVVATDSGGVRDLLGRARLVRPGDVGTLRARIVQALADPDLEAVQAAATRARTQLSPAAAVKRTEEAWGAAIAAYRAL